VNAPSPAIVAQSAVRRLPRIALWLFCLAYVLPGFIGREPWKNADMQGFGYMFELARGATDWLAPTLMGLPPEFDALLPYWLGAWAIRASAGWLPADLAVRLPYMGLLALTLLATWHAVYQLARSPRAQPVAFAFGGEANPKDYARALADAGLLALIACLGLAQFSHETTPSLAQLAFTALTFYGLAALPHPLAETPNGESGWRPRLRASWPLASLATGLAGLTLSGAPTLSLLFALGGAGVLAVQTCANEAQRQRQWRWALGIAAGGLAAAALALAMGLWHWRLDVQGRDWRDWRALGRLVLWFTWPAWPLAVWTVWRWRHQLRHRHLALPLWLVGVALASTLTTPYADRSLLLALPALAVLAAFSLPTLSRSISALIDWFTLLFFSGIALIVWVVWVSLQTGMPAKPAANVARLAIGFEPSFSALAFALALAGTVAWGALVRWRTGRHRAALWKSLVLPAGGAALCWLLFMTLWLPVLDYARSYVPVVETLQRTIRQDGTPAGACVEVTGLARSQVAALRYHGGFDLRLARDDEPQCPWRIAGADPANAGNATATAMPGWQWVTTARRPTDPRDNLRLYRAVR